MIDTNFDENPKDLRLPLKKDDILIERYKIIECIAITGRRK